jgi:hypothetical protein
MRCRVVGRGEENEGNPVRLIAEGGHTDLVRA